LVGNTYVEQIWNFLEGWEMNVSEYLALSKIIPYFKFYLFTSIRAHGPSALHAHRMIGALNVM
jgi:hypothetical protein